MSVLPPAYIWTVAGLVGLSIGSFLNVCICRWPADESVVAPPSHCPNCDHKIGWQDNIPVISYLLLRGRCRGCGTSISALYPAIEIATGLIWVAAAVQYGVSWEALRFAVFFTVLLGIAVTDAREYIIPDEFSLGGFVLGLLFSLAPGGLTPLQSLIGAAVGFGLLYLTAIVGERVMNKPAMGGGDIKMMAMLGAFLGPLGAVLSIFLGALVGTLVFVPISLRTKRLVPFGIFLAVGAAVTDVWGQRLIDWYVGFALG